MLGYPLKTTFTRDIRVGLPPELARDLRKRVGLPDVHCKVCDNNGCKTCKPSEHPNELTGVRVS